MDRSASREKKKKKRRRQSLHDDNRFQSDHIPVDLIIEILSRLPAKSITRFRLVSKLWSTITRSSDFIKSFETRSRPACTFLTVRRKSKKLFVFSSPLHQDDYPYPPQVEKYQFRVPSTKYNDYHKRYDSVHGLICLETKTGLVIWNPTMRRLFPLPKFGCSPRRGFLGYDPVNGKYKALCFCTYKIGILTWGAQESWRILSKDISNLYFPTILCERCINGVIYYVSYNETYNQYNYFGWRAIMSFDLKSEKFNLIKYRKSILDKIMVSYEGRLALVKSTDSGVELSILEDAENHKWISQHFPSPPPPYSKWTLHGVTNAGEFIYIHTPTCTYHSDRLIPTEESLYESFCVAYFDPKKKSVREFKLGRIADDDIRRLDEVGFDLRSDLVVIPDHIESLIISL